MTYVGPARNDRELGAAVRLAAETFHVTNDPVAAFDRKMTLLSGERQLTPTDVVVVTLSEGRVIGTIVLIDRIMPRLGVELPVTYMSSICIAEDMRGRGYSVDLVNEAKAACQRRGSAMAFLIARRAVDHYYTKFNFWGLSSYNQTSVNLSATNSSTPSIGLRAAQLNDLKQCEAFYDRAYVSAFGHHHRNGTFWTFLLRKLHILGVEFLVADGPNEIAGYLMASQARILEFAVEESLSALSLLAAYAKRSNLQRLTVDLPPSHGAASQLLEHESLVSRECRYGGHMGAVIDREKLLSMAGARIQKRAEISRLPATIERLDGLEYIWNGKTASVSVCAATLDFATTARLFGATQLSTSHRRSALDPDEPFNILFADQV
jgi:N-acetylglutamate synthase-like GNAT family acetyltransferase